MPHHGGSVLSPTRFTQTPPRTKLVHGCAGGHCFVELTHRMGHIRTMLTLAWFQAGPTRAVAAVLLTLVLVGCGLGVDLDQYSGGGDARADVSQDAATHDTRQADAAATEAGDNAGGQGGTGDTKPESCASLLPRGLSEDCTACFDMECGNICEAFHNQPGALEVTSCLEQCPSNNIGCMVNCYSARKELFGLGIGVWYGAYSCGATNCLRQCRKQIDGYPELPQTCADRVAPWLTQCGACWSLCTACQTCLKEPACRNYTNCRDVCGVLQDCKTTCDTVFAAKDKWADAFGLKGSCSSLCIGPEKTCGDTFCKNVIFDNSAESLCSQCARRECGADCDTCMYDNDCFDVMQCIVACNRQPEDKQEECMQRCVSSSSGQAHDLYDAWNNCVRTKCKDPCHL